MTHKKYTPQETLRQAAQMALDALGSIDVAYRSREGSPLEVSFDEEKANKASSALRAALTMPDEPVTAATHKLVPVEPTPEMLSAARAAHIPAVLIDSYSGMEDLRNKAHYRAMLYAAPQSPALSDTSARCKTLSDQVEHWSRKFTELRDSTPAERKPFTAAQRERLYRDAAASIVHSMTLAAFHRVVQYVEQAHEIMEQK